MHGKRRAMVGYWIYEGHWGDCQLTLCAIPPLPFLVPSLHDCLHTQTCACLRQQKRLTMCAEWENLFKVLLSFSRELFLACMIICSPDCFTHCGLFAWPCLGDKVWVHSCDLIYMYWRWQLCCIPSLHFQQNYIYGNAMHWQEQWGSSVNNAEGTRISIQIVQFSIMYI